MWNIDGYFVLKSHLEMCTSQNIYRCNKLFVVFVVIEDTVSRAQIKLTDVADTLKGDWVVLAQQLDFSSGEINQIKNDYNTVNDQALAMLQLWAAKDKEQATGKIRMG